MHCRCLTQLIGQEDDGQEQALDAPVVGSGKACKKSTATVWTGSLLIHALICQVLVNCSNDCDQSLHCGVRLVRYTDCVDFLKTFEAAVH